MQGSECTSNCSILQSSSLPHSDSQQKRSRAKTTRNLLRVSIIWYKGTTLKQSSYSTQANSFKETQKVCKVKVSAKAALNLTTHVRCLEVQDVILRNGAIWASWETIRTVNQSTVIWVLYACPSTLEISTILHCTRNLMLTRPPDRNRLQVKPLQMTHLVSVISEVTRSRVFSYRCSYLTCLSAMLGVGI